MAENEKKVPFFKKFVGRFLLVALVPAIVLEVTITLYAASQMKSNMKDTGLEGLTELATSVLSAAQKNGFTIKDDKFVDSNGVAVAENYFDSFVDGTTSHITIFSGDTRIVTTIIQDGKRVIGTKAAEKVIEVCLKGGNKYETKSVSVVGQDFMACYLPFKDNTGKTVGMVFVGKPTATIKKETTNSANKLVIVGTLVLLAAIADIVYFARSMSKRMVEAEASCRELAQGNLGIELSEALLKRSDEIGSIGRTVKLLSDSLKEIVGNIKNSSDELGMTSKTLGEMSSAIDGTSTEINETVEVITQGAISQTEEIDAASRSVNDIGEEITNISESILLLDEAAQEMSKAGRESNVIVQELRESNDHTTESINKIEEQINATNESAEKIRFAVEAISSIASQTNLLSLNASIEAARAGEAGRGFAVVATEIQKLADQSAQSASEIERIVKTLYEDSERSVETMKEAKVILTEQEEKLDKTTKQFGLINDGIKKSNEETEKIKQQITVCNESKNQIIDAMRKLNGISQDNSASMEETAASMEELNTNINILSNEALKIGSMSKNLSENIAVFKL